MHINLLPFVQFNYRISPFQQRTARPLPAQVRRSAALLSREDLQREIYALLG